MLGTSEVRVLPAIPILTVGPSLELNLEEVRGCKEQGLSLCGRGLLRHRVFGFIPRTYHNDSAATQTVLVDAARRGNGLWHL